MSSVCYITIIMPNLKRTRVVLGGFIGVLLTMLVWALLAGIKRHAVAPSSDAVLSQADIGMEPFSFRYSHKGRLVWDIHAERAELFDARHELGLHQLRAILQTQSGLQVRITARRGLLNTENHDFKIEENSEDLLARMSNGYTLQASSLVWTDESRTIVSDRPIQLLGQGISIRGSRLWVDFDNQELNIYGDVHVRIGL